MYSSNVELVSKIIDRIFKYHSYVSINLEISHLGVRTVKLD